MAEKDVPALALIWVWLLLVVLLSGGIFLLLAALGVISVKEATTGALFTYVFRIVLITGVAVVFPLVAYKVLKFRKLDREADRKRYKELLEKKDREAQEKESQNSH
ncbi:MAG: hypothetical protein E3J72_02730 [Planctomycetota bacterium]|nr:MAG: hypothetical protein E3J72_02730 [Planctomycetota bacterium]